MAEYIEKSKVERMLWAVIMSKDERTIKEMLEDAPIVNAISIPDDATNGDIIKAMFPDAQIDYHEESDFVDGHVTVFPKDCDTCQDYSIDYWNAPYMKGAEE